MIAWIVKLITKFYIPYTRKLDASEFRMLDQNDFKGSVIASYTPWSLSNFFINGRFGHVGFIVDKFTVIEATVKHGVKKTYISDFLKGRSKYMILMPKFYNNHEMEFACEAAEMMIGLQYDFSLDDRSEAKYCSELLNDVFIKTCSSYEESKDFFGVVHPDAFVNGEQFKPLFGYRV